MSTVGVKINKDYQIINNGVQTYSIYKIFFSTENTAIMLKMKY